MIKQTIYFFQRFNSEVVGNTPDIEWSFGGLVGDAEVHRVLPAVQQSAHPSGNQSGPRAFASKPERTHGLDGQSQMDQRKEFH